MRKLWLVVGGGWRVMGGGWWQRLLLVLPLALKTCPELVEGGEVIRSEYGRDEGVRADGNKSFVGNVVKDIELVRGVTRVVTDVASDPSSLRLFGMTDRIRRSSTLFILHCSLFIVHCSLFIVHCSLFIVHCSFFILLLPSILHSQFSIFNSSGADAVESFTPGEGQSTGQGPQYFPANVLGLPDSSARWESATADPKQILSLGLGGEIVLRFDRNVIVDGPGPDFTVFENAFHFTIGQRERTYAEPGEVAVSRDGITFVTFPYDSLTLKGCAGVTPTNGDKDPTNPEVSGGDRFDLADIGLDSIRFVRIRDVTSIIKGNISHPFWDPTLTGFDLDAVVAVNVADAVPLHVAEPIAGSTVQLATNLVSNSTSLQLHLDYPAHVRVRWMNMLGQQAGVVLDASVGAGRSDHRIDASGLTAGGYFLLVELDDRLLQTLPVRIVR